MTRSRVEFLCLSVFALILAIEIFAKWHHSPVIFGSFWQSGAALWKGTNPYISDGWTFVTNVAGIRVSEVNLNPPSLLPIFQLFATINVFTGAQLWALASGVMFVIPALYFTQRTEPSEAYKIGWLFVLPIWNIEIGQIYTVMFALSAAAWIAMERDKDILAGLAIGALVAMKPNFAVWPFLLFVGGYWRPVIVAGFTALALSALPAVLYGPDIYLQWLAAVKLDNHAAIFPHEVSLTGFFGRAGARSLGLVLDAALLLASVVVTWRNRPDRLRLTALAVPVAILCSPLAWVDYAIVATPALMSKRWNVPLMLAALMLCIPAAVTMKAVGTQYVSIVGLVHLGPILLIAWDGFASARAAKAGHGSGVKSEDRDHVSIATKQQAETTIDAASSCHPAAIASDLRH